MSGRFCIRADMQLCQGHGECMEEAPELFSVDYDAPVYPKVRVLQARVDGSLRQQAEAAVRACPNRVLSIQDLT